MTDLKDKRPADDQSRRVRPTGTPRVRGMAVYVFAVASALAVPLARHALSMDRPALILFLLPIIVSALLGGIGPGLLATVVAALSSAYFTIPPLHSFRIADSNNLLLWGILLGNGVLVSVLSEALHRARRRAEAGREQQAIALRVLQEGEDTYRSLFGHMLNGFAYCRMLYDDGRPSDFIHVDVNGAFEAQTGLKGVIGKRVTEVIPGIRESNPQLLEIYGQVARGGGPRRFETYVSALKMWFEISVYSPKPEHFVSVFDVISERKLAEKALARTLAEQQAILDSGVVGIIKARDRRFVWVNSAFEALLGYDPGELIGQSTRILYPDSQIYDRVGGAYEVLASGERWRDIVPLSRKNGQLVWVLISGGTATGDESVWAWVDVTEQHLAQEQLRKLSLAVEQSPNSVVITDTKAEIEYVNEAFTRTSGYTLEEVRGKDNRLMQSGQTPRETYSALWKALKAGQSWRGEFVNKRKNGEVFIEDEIFAPIRQPDGTVSHYLAIKEDITEKKRIAEELERHRNNLEDLVSERTRELDDARLLAETATQAKSTFLANMSHEIRTPMNAITGMVYLMKRDGVTPQQAERLNSIDHAAQHLLGILNNVLDLSKIEAGKLSLELTEVHAGSLAANVASMLIERAQEKGLALRVENEALPAHLQGDPTRLQQALLNYASNAIKFTHQGSVTLRTRLIEETATGALLRFEVEDTGIGIAADVLDKLFHAFEQADSATTRKYGGTGLGLAITRQLAHLMGGDAGAASTPGMGSSFWFTAMLSKGSGSSHVAPLVAAADPQETLRRECAGRRLLLAEDEPINCEIVLMLLGDLGLVIDVATDGAQALDLAARKRYDLILMDMQMPHMDGLEVTRRIRLLPDGARTRIVAMTANAFAEDKQRCFAAGMNDFITKPVDPGVLFRTLLRWLSRQSDSAQPP